MSRPRLSSLGIALTRAPTLAGRASQSRHATRADVGRRPQQPFLEQPDDRLQFGDVAVIGLAIGLDVTRDLLARQAAAARQQIVAVAGQEIVGLAQHDLEPVPLELEVADDLGLEQADGVARRRVAETGQELVGDRGPADIAAASRIATLAPSGEIISAGQAVVAGADDDRVVQVSALGTAPSASAPALRPWSDEAQPWRRNRLS